MCGCLGFLPSDLILLAAKHHADSGGEAVIGLILTIVISVIYAIAAIRKSDNAVWKGGIPYCPSCGRQISLKFSRSHCRSCGYNLVGPPAQSNNTTTRAIGELQIAEQRRAEEEQRREQQRQADIVRYQQEVTELNEWEQERVKVARLFRERVQAARLLRQRQRREWCKRNEAWLLGLGLPLVVVVLTVLLIIAIHHVSQPHVDMTVIADEQPLR
jgi:hypothetical protein